jgi:hypothetical protein
MAELVDAPDSKSGEEIRESSTLSLPIVRTVYIRSISLDNCQAVVLCAINVTNEGE